MEVYSDIGSGGVHGIDSNFWEIGSLGYDRFMEKWVHLENGIDFGEMEDLLGNQFTGKMVKT